MQNTALAWVRRFAAAGVIGCLASCGSSPKAPVAAPLAATAEQASFERAVMGVAPEISFFVRPVAARADANWGPLVQRVLSGRDRESDFLSHGSGGVLLGARQIDLHFARRDILAFGRDKGDPRSFAWLGVIYGLPPTDPQAFRDGSGRPLFAAPTRLPSGVLELDPSAEYAQEFSPLAPTLFVTPDGTALVTDAVSAAAARDLLARDPSPPAPLEAASDSLGGATASVTSLRFINASEPSREPFLRGVIVSGVGLRGGSFGSVDGYVDYASSEDARLAFSAWRRACAESGSACALEPGLFRDAKVELSGPRLLLTLSFSDALMRSIRDFSP